MNITYFEFFSDVIRLPLSLHEKESCSLTKVAFVWRHKNQNGSAREIQKRK